jgi:hypothetical protein
LRHDGLRVCRIRHPLPLPRTGTRCSPLHCQECCPSLWTQTPCG